MDKPACHFAVLVLRENLQIVRFALIAPPGGNKKWPGNTNATHAWPDITRKTMANRIAFLACRVNIKI